MTSASYSETSTSLHCITSQMPVIFNTLQKYENLYPSRFVEHSFHIGMPRHKEGRTSGEKAKRNKNKNEVSKPVK